MDKALIGIVPGKEKYVHIIWQVNDTCNYKCSYCNEGNWGGRYKNDNFEQFEPILQKIVSHFKDQNYNNFKIFFSGGEPSLWKPLIPVIEFFRENTQNPRIAINTNLSRSLDWWKKNYHYFQDIIASFHVEFADKDRYLDNFKFLQYRIPYLVSRVLLHDKRFKEVVEFAERLKSESDNYYVEYAPLMSELNSHSEDHYYEEEWKRKFIADHQLDRQKEVDFCNTYRPKETYHEELREGGRKESLNSNRLVALGENRFKGWQCWVQECIYIHPSGDITMGSCRVTDSIGHLSTGEISIPKESVICPFERCNCGTDISVTKLHPEHLNDYIDSFSNPITSSEGSL